MSDWVTGLFAIGGVVGGTALEPVKNIFNSRSRVRQIRSERCAELITVASRCFHHESTILEDLELYLTVDESSLRMDTDQIRATTQAYRDIRPEIVKVAALITLFGPAELTYSADKIVEAESLLNDAIIVARDTSMLIRGAHADDLKRAIREFAISARKYC